MKKIVVFCGGSGAYTLLLGLMKILNLDITVITTPFDTGGSQGVILAGDKTAIALADAVKCLVALATNKDMARLFRHRFIGDNRNGLTDYRHTVGNIIWYALKQLEYRPREALTFIARMLGTQPEHRVELTALERATLCVQLEDGQVIRGETNIDIPKHDGSLKIIQAWLEPAVMANPYALQAIIEADFIIIAPGDLFTSSVACLLPEGTKKALRDTRAPLLYVGNLMTKWGETYEFCLSDFVGVIEEYAGRQVDAIIHNTAAIPPGLARRYGIERATPVENDFDPREGKRVIGTELLDLSTETARHDSDKLAQLIAGIVFA